MRSFIRHPSDIPIDFQLGEVVNHSSDYLRNVSRGGLAFHSQVALDIDSIIQISIPLVEPVFEAVGRVTWCKPMDGEYEVGVEFLEDDDIFRARMVEQICHIEHYKQEMLKCEGRKLSGEQAAAEWIKKYAPQFPNFKKG
jgi:hypothetical protein